MKKARKIGYYLGHLIVNLIVWIGIALILSNIFDFDMWHILIVFVLVEVVSQKAKKSLDETEMNIGIKDIIKKGKK